MPEVDFAVQLDSGKEGKELAVQSIHRSDLLEQRIAPSPERFGEGPKAPADAEVTMSGKPES
jgi:hypothetical protein